MSDYLSHLARASGLAVGKRTAARGVAPRGHVAAPTHAGKPAPRDTAAESSSADAPHVERVTFVEQPRVASRRAGEFEGAGDGAARMSGEGYAANTGRVESLDVRSSRREGDAREYARARSSDAATHTRAGESESFSAAREVRTAGHVPEEGSVRFVGPDDAVGRTKHYARRLESLATDAAGELTEAARSASQSNAHAHASDETVTVAPRESSDASVAGPTDARADARDAHALESLDPADARRAYMREIVEWISAPPSSQADDDEARERVRLSEREKDEARAAAVVEIVDERDAATSLRARAEAERAPEVDDFTLSIGSIHVVVEEPPGQTVARPAPQSPAQAQGGRASDGGDDAVARLRRHYIRL